MSHQPTIAQLQVSLSASQHQLEEETMPLLILLNISGMPVASKEVVKRKNKGDTWWRTIFIWTL